MRGLWSVIGYVGLSCLLVAGCTNDESPSGGPAPDETGGGTGGGGSQTPDGETLPLNTLELTVSGEEFGGPFVFVKPLGEFGFGTVTSSGIGTSKLFMDDPIVAQGQAGFPRFEVFTFRVGTTTSGTFNVGDDFRAQFDINFTDNEGNDSLSLQPVSGSVTVDFVSDTEVRGTFSTTARATQGRRDDVDFQVSGRFRAAYHRL
jgi:hypothetical protein